MDGSAPSTAAVRWAVGDARLRHAALRLVHVIAPVSETSTSPWDGISARADRFRFTLDKRSSRRVLESAYQVVSDAVPRPEFPVRTEVLAGSTAPTLAACAKQADMLVVGRGGRNAFARALFGSVSSGLVHHAVCPLAVIHEGAGPGTKAPVVVGIDGSPASEPALRIAFDEASRRGVDLVAMHTWSDEGPVSFGRPGHSPIEWANFQEREEGIAAAQLADWRARYPAVSVHAVVVADRPAHRLLQLAETAQLLVVGSHSHGRFTGIRHDSVSSTVATAAQIPVIVTHSPRTAA